MKKPRRPEHSAGPPASKAASSRHAPREMRVTGPVGYVGRSVGVDGVQRANKGFDPRFEELCGTVKAAKLQRDYAFVADMRKDEKESLRRAAAAEKDPTRKAQLAFDLQRMNDKDRGQTWADKTSELRERLKSEEREKVKNGKKPYYMKRSSMRELETKLKYDELKSQGKLSKYIEKRRKKQASRDKKQLPALRSPDSD